MSTCPRCGNQLQWVPQYSQWYCWTERQYLAPSQPAAQPAQQAAQTGAQTNAAQTQQAAQQAAPQAAQSAQPAQQQQQAAQYPCPGCRQPLTWVAQYNQWYCYAEQRYYPPAY